MPSATLQPQAALETAIRNALRTTLVYRAEQCDRTLDARPSLMCPPLFVGVWSEGERNSTMPTCLNEEFGVNVTVTIRSNLPYDRMLTERDAIEYELNRIRALIHGDVYNHAILNAANVLADLGTGATQHIGFTKALRFLRFEPISIVDGRWFQAEAEEFAGLSQTARFGGAQRVQALPYMA